jgi:glutathione S-transferase
MGSGKFSALLPYKDWLLFNNAQRGHQNFLEGLPSFYAALFAAGLQKPKLAAWLGAIYCVGRAAYRSGYARGGPNGRMLGAGLSAIGSLGLIGSCMYQGWMLAQPMKQFQ